MYYKKDLTSIIMPTCHKLLKTNKLCFEKSIKQNYRSIEFLILISGMNRREYEKIVNFLNKKNIYNHKLKTIYSLDKVGIGEARRKLLTLSQGEYIIFLDSDDLPIKGLIKKKVSISKKFNSNIIFSNAKVHNNKNFKSKKIILRNYYIYLTRFKKFFNAEIFDGINLFPNSGTLIKRNKENNCLLKNYPICKHEDFIFYKRFIELNKEFTISNKYMISYNIEGTSTSNKLKSRLWHYNCLVKELNRNKIKSAIYTIFGLSIILLIRFYFILTPYNKINSIKNKKIIING